MASTGISTVYDAEITLSEFSTHCDEVEIERPSIFDRVGPWIVQPENTALVAFGARRVGFPGKNSSS
jgi:hypothetical protein